MKKFLSLLTVVAVVFMSAIPVFADYTAVAGPSVPMSTTIAVGEGATTPATSVNYSIAPGAAVAASATGDLPVLAGIGSPVINSGNDVAFTSGQAVTGGKATTAWNIDFSGINYTSPGIYRYVVTQNTITPSTIKVVNGEETTSTIDIYVQDNNGALQVSAVVYDGTVTAVAKADGTNLGTKDSEFPLEYETYDLSASKTVTGNQGDKFKVWNFQLEIGNLEPGTPVNYVDVDNTAGQFTADDTGKIQHVFLPKHGESFSVTGLPVGATYKVTEDQANQDGYTTTGEVLEATTIDNVDVKVGIINDRAGVVPTGVALYAGVGLVLMIGAGVYLGSKSRKHED